MGGGDDVEGKVIALTSSGTAPGRILRALHTFGPMSRADLTRATQMSRSTVGGALADLERWEIVHFSKPDEGLRGRPSAAVALVPDRIFSVVFDIGPRSIQQGIVQLDRTIVDVRDVPLNHLQPDRVVARMVELVEEATAGRPGQCVGVGISLPGVASPAGDAVLVLPLGWQNYPVAQRLAEALGRRYPIAVAQDAYLAARAEYVWGAGANLERMLYLIGRDHGVGGAIIGLGSQEGATHPLQAGHIPVRPGGRACECGGTGCLEKYIDADAVRETLARLGVVGAPLPEAIAAVSDGPVRAGFVGEVIEPLRVGLVTLVNALGPDGVVLGGGLRHLGDHFFPELQAAVADTVVAHVRDVQLKRATLEDPIIQGCGLRAFEILFNDPRSCGVDRATRRSGGLG